jgi:phospholipase C
MDTRREFLKKAALLAAGGGLTGAFPASIQRAFAIDPAPGTTYLDAEHVVILMQENRSFDHCYGTLRGVRGFNDPRAVTLPDGNPVWLQTNTHGETYAPFRLNIKDTKATWMSSLPHSWEDQTEARNGGKHDRWLPAKPSGHKDYTHLPLTLGYYNRDDLPFYYALADAFTICDQNFCSSLTGTTPNRLYLWTGTIREKPSIEARANVWNSDVDYDSEASWMTFPERLEDAGISWRIYQNEVSLDTGFKGDEEGWLANFTDNPIEWFTQYQVRFSQTFRDYLPERAKLLAATLEKLEAGPLNTAAQKKKINQTRAELAAVRRYLETYTAEQFAKLDARAKNIHQKAFTTNQADPHYRQLATLNYEDGDKKRQMQVPKGDVLHQFRENARTGTLPAVSWIVAPENFSDHPGAPWYGAWYLSEVFDILTQNPEVWKKTIFVLAYDENDGYFDHVPPFVPPHPAQPGKVSANVDSLAELVIRNQATANNSGEPVSSDPIGLGFRVPLVIASPWSRGGYVCSQVFDHTSVLQLLENWLSHKTGKPVRETNISDWRRTVCGDLSSCFRPYAGEQIDLPPPVKREAFLGSIHQAQFKPLPNGFRKLTAAECALSRENPPAAAWLPQQEKGTRPACALPYEIEVSGGLTADGKLLALQFAAGRRLFGVRTAGVPFHVWSPGKVRGLAKDSTSFETGRRWAYAAAAGDRLSGEWPLADFEDATYHLCVNGPNGFFREFRGDAKDPALELSLEAIVPSSPGQFRALLKKKNMGEEDLTVLVGDLTYGAPQQKVLLRARGTAADTSSTVLELDRSQGWYDVQIRVSGAAAFERRLAGHVENGYESFSDPAMGRMV